MSDPNGVECRLQMAAYANDTVTLQSLLEGGAAANDMPEWPRATALHFASSNGQVDAIAMLLDYGASVEAEDEAFYDSFGGEPAGNTALHLAAGCGFVDAARLLLEHGANVDARNELEQTPLHVAAKGQPYYHIGYYGKPSFPTGPADYAATVRLLLDHGADVEAFSNQDGTPERAAACAGKVETLEVLLSLRPSASNPPPCLLFAAWEWQAPTVQWLVDYGASVSTRGHGGNTPLHQAAWRDIFNEPARGHCYGYNCWPLGTVFPEATATARVLVDAGADVNARNDDGVTALHRAAEACETRGVVALLLERGADVNAVDVKGTTPLFWVAGGGPVPRGYDTIDTARMLVSHGASVTARAHNGATPLHYAAGLSIGFVTLPPIQPGTAMVELFLARGADPNALTILDSQTPLHFAARAANTPSIKHLLSAGADPSLASHCGWTPLHYALTAGELSQDAVTLLAAHTPRPAISHPTEYGVTPLHFAVLHSPSLPMVQALLARGANVNVRTTSGATRNHVKESGTTALPWTPPRRMPSWKLEGERIWSERYGDNDIVGNETPLHWAATRGLREPMAPRHDDCEPQYVHQKGAEGSISVVGLLLAAGAAVEAKDAEGKTALLRAARSGKTETVRELLEAGTEVRATDLEGRTAKEMAEIAGWKDTAELLMSWESRIRDAATAEV